MRAAAYCRVSTDRADQASSFESQVRYFREYIAGRPEWELYEIYADEGVTGTSTRRRTEFNRMLDDARQGKFGIILTKEVSRFSRNILDTIAYTRELRRLGVGVLFVSDGINTLDADAELRLSIMGSIAQEESRRTSARVKWGQARQMERGVVFGRSLLGYNVEGGHMTVEPEGAAAVRTIFRKYCEEGKSASEVAAEMEAEGYRTLSGRGWRGSYIVKVLRNEKYAGDLVQKKTITPDYLTHEKRYNHGEEELIVLRDHHEPIVSRELWELAQMELRRRRRSTRGAAGCSHKYRFSGKIWCGECGRSFVARGRRVGDRPESLRWRCYNALSGGCTVEKTVSDRLAGEMLCAALGRVEFDRAETVDALAAAVIAGAGGAENCGAALRRAEELVRRPEAVDAFCELLERIEIHKGGCAILRLCGLPVEWEFEILPGGEGAL